MEYSVGSLADLISGQKTPNKTKIIQKTFIPLRKDPEIPDVKTNLPKTKSPKTFKTKSPNKKSGIRSSKIKQDRYFKKLSLNSEKEQDKLNWKDKAATDKTSNLPSPKSLKNSVKPKHKKRKLSESNEGADVITPKKQKLSKNEENAASRIKNKINKENKNSGEYKDKTLYVGNIPISATKKKIKKCFSKYGPIDSIRIRGIPVADPKTSKKVAAIKKEFHPDRNTVYAFIRFVNSEDAKKAEAENGEIFLDHHLRVHCCESNEKPDEAKAIFVGNVAFNAEEEELWNLFKTCGPISHVRIVRDGRTGMGKGFAYINFKDTDSVQLALEMEKIIFKDRELRISLCDINRSKKKKLGKKPKNVKSKTTEKDEGQVSKEKKFNKNKSNTKGVFAGTKFNDAKKKKKVSKATFEKKKLVKKLAAPQPQKS